MKNIPMNKLWACLPTTENIKIISQFPMFRATEDHCLVISAERPEGCVNVGKRRIKLLDSDDWKWIQEQSAIIKAEQEAEYKRKMERETDIFLERFEQELKSIRKERRADGEKKRGNPKTES